MQMIDHIFFMKRALSEAEKAFKKNEVPVGAVLVKKGKLLSSTHNLREKGRNLLGHAEILALQAGGRKLKSWRLTGCCLYVSLEPCLMCMGAIVQSRISHLFYACSDFKTGFSSYYGLDKQEYWTHRININSGIYAEESSQLLKKFFKGLR